MKKLLIFAAIFGMFFATTSCDDMLETDSDQKVFNPALDQKTDSMYYTLAILKGVQMAIDQNVLINEMRGDLTSTTSYSETALRELANFSAGANNKYDSAYVYYRIINNCNYYIAHRDTLLMTGSTKVTIPEYVQALSVRAWAYMQLCKNYGTVDFYTTPIASISEANAPKEKKDLAGVVDALAPELARFSTIAVPYYGTINAGNTNFNSTKEFNSRKIMFPAALVLGDMYLETNQYEQAAKYYFQYLQANKVYSYKIGITPSSNFNYPNNGAIPASFTGMSYNYSWDAMYDVSPKATPLITFVPMAVNSMSGTTTNLPKLFGYNYYTTDVDTTNNKSQTTGSAMYLLERQIEASSQYVDLCNKQDWYYQVGSTSTDVLSSPLGDMRRYYTVQSATKGDSTYNRITKFDGGNIIIYRSSTIYLRLAEALNRMGYPDAAFAILKDGICENNLQEADYLRPETRELLTTTIPFLSEANKNIFNGTTTTTSTSTRVVGIHSYGANATLGKYSPYKMETVVANKLAELEAQGLTLTGTMNDTINAMEDILCDEYALEFAFEGTRFGDLTRLARHKNADTTYGANYGGQWIARKLAFKHPVKDLTDENNWYLPMK